MERQYAEGRRADLNAEAGVPAKAQVERESIVVPVIQEEMRVERQRVETGRVRVHKRVTEREEVIDEPVLQETVEVERVTVNRPVDGPPPIRYEGDTMIIPILEEVMVVEKRLMLKEEVRIRKRESIGPQPQRVVLRSEEVEIERVAPGGSTDSTESARQPLDPAA